MCHSLTPVVLHASRRKVLRCSCGTLHVVWENLNLSLDAGEFRDLLHLAAAGQSGAQGEWHAHHGQSGTGLWCGPLGATFRPEEWPEFVLLLQAAAGEPAQVQTAAYMMN